MINGYSHALKASMHALYFITLQQWSKLQANLKQFKGSQELMKVSGYYVCPCIYRITYC